MNKQEFKHFYNDNIYPILKPYETKRKEIANEINTIKTISLFVTYGLATIASIGMINVGLAMGMYLSEILLKFVLPTVTIALVITGIIRYCNINTKEQKQKISRFKMEIKRKCLNKILSTLGEIEWQEKSQSDEVITGKYNDVDFRIVETDSDIILNFTSIKNFSSKTAIEAKYRRIFLLIASYIAIPSIIIANIYLFIAFLITQNKTFIKLIIHSALYSIVFFLSALNIIFKYNGYKKTKIEDINFNKYFTIYTEDEVEARYFLTPTFVERFQNFKNAFGNCKISCSCEQNNITFVLKKKKDLFEITDINTPFISSQAILVLYNEIQAIFEMIKYFKFDEKTRI